MIQNRRDQAQAHSFVVSRLVSGMLRAEPDAPMTPLRRFLVGTLVGVLLGGLVVVGFAIFGAIFPGGAKSWRQAGALVVEKETGARYVYIDGQLRPVLNYTSARLILGGEPKVARVSRNSLKGVPHGSPVGIPSAPDSLPDLRRVDGARWQVCSSVRKDAAGAPRPFVTVWVGAAQTRRSLEPDEALVVRTPAGQSYLVWNNMRLAVPSATALGALGYAAVPQQLVGSAWVNSVPAGPDLVVPNVPGLGQAGPTINGRATIVGQLFKANDDVAAGSGSQYFVVRSDGLSPLSPIGAVLMLADPNTRKGYPAGPVEAFPLSAAALAAAPRSQATSVTAQHPTRPPRVTEVRTGEAPCVQLGLDAASGPTVQLGLRAIADTRDAAPAPQSADRLLADRMVVAPGAGLLIRNQPAPGVTDGALYLLVDIGVRYPLHGDKTLGVLGYDKVSPVPVPVALLGLFPVGPPLDPDAARATASVTGPAGPAGPAGGAQRETGAGGP